MFKEMLEALVKENKKEVRVGVVTGELHEAWKKYQCAVAIHSHELEAKKAAFALEFLRRHEVNGMFNFDPDEAASLAGKSFQNECADWIADHKRRARELEQERDDLWQRTYKQLDLSPAESCRIKVSTGEVFEILDTDGDDDAEDRPVH